MISALQVVKCGGYFLSACISYETYICNEHGVC